MLRDADAGGLGRAGAGHGFLCADAGGSGAGVYGNVHRDQRDEFGGAGAADAVWHGSTEEEILTAHGDRGNARSVLPDGAGRRVRRGGDSSAGDSRRKCLQTERHEDLGNQRKHRGRTDCVCENRSGGGRIGIAAQAVGLAEGALEETVKYAKQRAAFGHKIGEFQAIQWMIADIQTEVEAARGLVHYAAWLKDVHPTKVGASASKAKLYASEMVNRVVYKAVQVHGSVGYSRETNVERMYRDARVITIYEGTSEVQRMIIARDLLGKAS